MIIKDFDDLINKDIHTYKKLKNSFNVDIYTSYWRHYELADAIGGIVAYEDNGRIMVKFFEYNSNGYYFTENLNMLLDSYWIKSYKDALERMYNWLECNCVKDKGGYTKLLNFKMKTVMICQPMNGLTNEEIEKTKLEATQELSKEGYEVVNTFFNGSEECEWADNKKNIPVAYLSMSIAKMSEVDAVYFCKGWSKARECKVERQVAENYGYKILGFEK